MWEHGWKLDSTPEGTMIFVVVEDLPSSSSESEEDGECSNQNGFEFTEQTQMEVETETFKPFSTEK